jgi:hypothetical protein
MEEYINAPLYIPRSYMMRPQRPACFGAPFHTSSSRALTPMWFPQHDITTCINPRFNRNGDLEESKACVSRPGRAGQLSSTGSSQSHRSVAKSSLYKARDLPRPSSGQP